MRITNSFLIGLKTCSQNYNPYQESVSGQEPVTRKVLGSRREPTTITLLDMALSPHLMTSSHQLMHFSKCIRKKLLLSFSVNIKNLNTFRCRILQTTEFLPQMAHLYHKPNSQVEGYLQRIGKKD